jgi:hypothetical protein
MSKEIVKFVEAISLHMDVNNILREFKIFMNVSKWKWRSR